ncbi:MAG: hypothetical protein ACPGU1_19010 [Myxococcota bacterium]
MVLAIRLVLAFTLTLFLSPVVHAASSNCVNSPGSVFGDPLSMTDIAEGPGGVLYALDGEKGHLYEQDGTGVFRAVLAGERGRADGPTEEAQLMGAYGLAGTDARLYIADTLGHTIRVMQAGNLLTLAGDGVRGLKDGAGDTARFGHVYDVSVGADGTLYVADATNHAIRAITHNASFGDVQVSTIAGGVPGMADGAADVARFKRPVAVAELPNGDLVVADQGNNRIRRITPGGEVSTWVGGRYGYGLGRGTDAALGFVSGLSVAPDGLVYIADRTVPGILSIDPEGYVMPLTGTGQGSGTGNADGSYFSIPGGVEVRDDGTVLVADLELGHVRELDRCGGGGVDAGACAGMSCDILPFLDPACLDADDSTYCAESAPAVEPKKLVALRKNGNNTRSVVNLDRSTGAESVGALLSDSDVGTYGGHSYAADGRTFRMVGPAVVNNNLAQLFLSYDATTGDVSEGSWFGNVHGLEVTSGGSIVWVYKEGTTHKLFKRAVPAAGEGVTPFDGVSQELAATDIASFTDGSKSDLWGNLYFLQGQSGGVEYVYTFNVTTGAMVDRIATPTSPTKPGTQTSLTGWAMPDVNTVLFAEWDAGASKTHLYSWDMKGGSVTDIGVIGDLWSGTGIGYTAIDTAARTITVLGGASFNGNGKLYVMDYVTGEVMATHVLAQTRSDYDNLLLVDDVPPTPCDPSPCLNDAGCIEYEADYVCTCQPDWGGDNCEIDISECPGCTTWEFSFTNYWGVEQSGSFLVQGGAIVELNFEYVQKYPQHCVAADGGVNLSSAWCHYPGSQWTILSSSFTSLTKGGFEMKAVNELGTKFEFFPNANWAIYLYKPVGSQYESVEFDGPGGPGQYTVVKWTEVPE